MTHDASTPPGTKPSEEDAGESWGWTRAHRVGIGILMAAFLVLLIIQYAMWPARLDDPVVIVHGEAITLARRMDPNTASAEQLARIPRVGEKLAQAIVMYRDARKTVVGDGIVFHELADIDRVPGIGKKLLEQMSDYLEFPEEEAASQP